MHQAKNKLQALERKPMNQLQKNHLVEGCCKAAVFFMKHCAKSMNIKEEWNSILTGCPTLNERVVFASMLHVFVAKHEQEETTLWIDRGFHFIFQPYCIFLTGLP